MSSGEAKNDYCYRLLIRRGKCFDHTVIRSIVKRALLYLAINRETDQILGKCRRRARVREHGKKSLKNLPRTVVVSSVHNPEYVPQRSFSADYR